MKPLSQSLGDLAVQVKSLEDSATATFEADGAKLEQRRQEIDEELQRETGELESAVSDADAAGRTWWSETKASMKRPIDELRAGIEARKSEHELHHAVHHAEEAEEDAAAAVELAAYFNNVAEYAVIDATLARMSADDMADGAKASSEAGTS